MLEIFRHAWNVLKTRFSKRYIFLFILIFAFYEGMQIVASYFPSFAGEIAKMNLPLWQEIGFFCCLFIHYSLFTVLDCEIDMLIIKKHIGEVYRFLNLITFDKLVGLDEAWYQKNDSGALATKITKGVNRIVELLKMLSWELIPAVLQLLLSLIPLVLFAPATLPIVIISCVFFMWVTYKGHKLVTPLRKEMDDIDELSGSRFMQNIQGLPDIITSGQMEIFVNDYTQLQDEMADLSVKEATVGIYHSARYRIAINLGTQLLLLIVLYFQLKSGSISQPVFYGTLTVINRLFSSLSRFSRIYDQLEKLSEGPARIDNLLGEVPSVQNGYRQTIPQGDVVFSKVNFAYDENAPLTIKSLDLVIKPGKTYAFVGPSGSGKTTLIKLLQRNYNLESGEIKIGGIDIREYTLDTLRSVIAVVPQSCYIFNTSIRDNILMGHYVSEDILIEVAKKAHLHEFITAKGGYDICVGDRGLQLSGGQRQRVGIARALLKATVLRSKGVIPIIILDEPTSALDSQTELIIMEGIQEMRALGATVMIIAHRLSTIQDADQICVLKSGSLIEAGTHSQLIEKQGVYAGLVAIQQL